MKTIKNVQLITWMLVALHVSGFNMNPNPNTLSQDHEAVRSNSPIEVLVKNSKGKIFYQGEIDEKDDLSGHFDITKLPAGDYVIERIYDLEIEVMPFKINEEESQVKFGITRSIYKPVIMSRGDLVYVSKPILNDNNLQIKIYNENNELIYSENIIKKGQIYDLSQVFNEDMKFVVYTDGRKYSETFKF